MVQWELSAPEWMIVSVLEIQRCVTTCVASNLPVNVNMNMCGISALFYAMTDLLSRQNVLIDYPFARNILSNQFNFIEISEKQLWRYKFTGDGVPTTPYCPKNWTQVVQSCDIQIFMEQSYQVQQFPNNGILEWVLWLCIISYMLLLRSYHSLRSVGSR